MRTSTWMRLLLPSFVNSASCSTCSSLAWSAGFISPISSSNIVPVSACSNLPIRVVAAPVNAPRSWPNSSLSSSSAGSAAQFTFTNGRFFRVERWWMARETSSLPTPLSPRIRTVTSLSATCSITVAMPRIFSLLPQTDRSSSSLNCWRSSLSSDTSRFFSMAFLIATSRAISPSPSGSSGFTT